MSIFNKLDTNSMEEVTDFTGGSSTSPSNIYKAKIKSAYEGVSPKGAAFIRYAFDLEGKEFSETVYVTSRDGNPYYVKDGKKFPLPGYSRANAIAMMVTGKELSEQRTETKVVKAYDPELGKETNQEVQMHVDLIDGEVYLGVLEVTKDKYNKPGTITINEIDSVFHIDTKQTLSEALGEREPNFWDKWLESNEGVLRDISGKSTGTNAPKGSGDSGGSKRTKSLFNK